MKTGIFVQIRLKSTRLPGKARLQLKGGTVIEQVMKALKTVPVDVYALLTDRESARQLAGPAGVQGFEVFVGPEEDVLERYCLAARTYQVVRIVRATGDNPLVSADQIEALMPLHNGAALSHYLNNLWGTGVEIVEAEALEEALARSTDPYEHEHITTYLYRNKDRFLVQEIPSPPEWCFPPGRVTLDTREDYQLISRIFEDLYRGVPIETGELISWLKADAQSRPNSGVG